MSVPLFQVDAFTAEPFAGNPAAVCLLPGEAEPAWMQTVAAEMNLSETAFVWGRPDGFGLRWFTPSVEVDLCGHATLASAHVLWQTGRLGAGDPARFHTAGGLLSARAAGGGWIELDFPAQPAAPASVPDGLDGLGGKPVAVSRSRLDLVAEFATEAEVRALSPDMGRLAAVPCRGIMATSPAADARFDYVLRFFAPQTGVDEDPVTGSAQCTLGPYWAPRLGREELVALQASPRGGVLRVRPVGDRVRIAGQAVTVMTGELL